MWLYDTVWFSHYMEDARKSRDSISISLSYEWKLTTYHSSVFSYLLNEWMTESYS